jgi:hypothetical protein
MRQHAEGLFSVDSRVRLAGGIPFPTRMTVIRLGDGSLALVSPVLFTPKLATELTALGEVSHVLQPNRLHDLHLASAAERFPRARLVRPGELASVVESTRALRDVLAVRPIDGVPKIEETVLYHPASRSLVVTDLAFNIERPPSWKTSVLLWMTGTRGRLAHSRVWRWSARDRNALRESLEAVSRFAFDRLIVAHGECIESGAYQRLASVLGWREPSLLPPARAPAAER